MCDKRELSKYKHKLRLWNKLHHDVKIDVCVRDCGGAEHRCKHYDTKIQATHCPSPFLACKEDLSDIKYANNLEMGDEMWCVEWIKDA